MSKTEAGANSGNSGVFNNGNKEGYSDADLAAGKNKLIEMPNEMGTATLKLAGMYESVKTLIASTHIGDEWITLWNDMNEDAGGTARIPLVNRA